MHFYFIYFFLYCSHHLSLSSVAPVFLGCLFKCLLVSTSVVSVSFRTFHIAPLDVPDVFEMSLVDFPTFLIFEIMCFS